MWLVELLGRLLGDVLRAAYDILHGTLSALYRLLRGPSLPLPQYKRVLAY